MAGEDVLLLNLTTLEQQIEQALHPAGATGMALGVVRGDELVYARGFGTTRVKRGISVAPGVVFRLGSVSKVLTGTAAMRLVEQGRVDLDTPVQTYLPDLAFSMPDAAAQVTLRMLLSHTSGLADGGPLVGSRDADGLQQYVAADIPRVPMVAPPGRLFCYSNHGINVAGRVLEAATGQRFADLMQELLFDPLAMKRSTYDPLAAMQLPLALPHHKVGGELRPYPTFPENLSQYPAWFAMSNVLDLANFMMLHLRGGQFAGQQLLAPETLAEMHRPQVDRRRASSESAALTWMIRQHQGYRMLWHTGAIGSYASSMVLVPEAGLGVVGLSNGSMSWDEVLAALDCWLPARSVATDAAAQPALPVADGAEYTGAYLGYKVGLVQIQPDADGLTLTLGGKSERLHPMGSDLFVTRNGSGGVAASVDFIRSPAGVVEHLLFNSKVCGRYALDPAFAPDPAAWEPWLGTYRHGGIAWVQVSVQDGRLRMQDDDGSDLVLTPVAPDLFEVPGVGQMAFQEIDGVRTFWLQGLWRFDLAR